MVYLNSENQRTFFYRKQRKSVFYTKKDINFVKLSLNRDGISYLDSYVRGYFILVLV